MKNLREQASEVLGREVKGEALSVTIRSLIEKVKEQEEETISAKEFLVQSRRDLKEANERIEKVLNNIGNDCSIHWVVRTLKGTQNE
jgi:hypothetical protein